VVREGRRERASWRDERLEALAGKHTLGRDVYDLGIGAERRVPRPRVGLGVSDHQIAGTVGQSGGPARFLHPA
jgi:hypothetical protein